MQDIKPEVWFPIFTLIVGSLLAAWHDRNKDRRTLERERASRLEQRNDVLRLKRLEFQRATLLDLQVASHDLCRCASQAHLADEFAKREGKTPNQIRQPGALAEDLRLALSKFQLLRVRVRDDDIRQLCTELIDATSLVALRNATHESNDQLMEMTIVHAQLHERTGAVLRGLDDDEESALGKGEKPKNTEK